uniref:Si:dkey-25g12.4 n=1 Tax=Echeneis naucrates TaxID=173247 RepID=A0A665UW28_ECHNA
MTGRGELPPTKTITVYRNGDAFFPGRKIVINPRQVSTFDGLLNALTPNVRAPFGAVRKLYTPAEGHKVQRLDDLDHGSVYVAAGNEKFKKLKWVPCWKLDKGIFDVKRIWSVVLCNYKMDSFTIFPFYSVFTNGDVLVPPARIRIPKFTLRKWENVLAMVTDKVFPLCGRLYTLDGHPVCASTELKNSQHYVAVGAEKFKPLPYDHWVPMDFMKDNTTEEKEKICHFSFPFIPCSQDNLPSIRKTRHAKDVVSTAASVLNAVCHLAIHFLATC